ncbi:hypothetical protein R1sor_017248 [Riccia sorocarpa]|uniref:Uncharacterized protein n=1 Tax=Riccia sorocarpa TaxID=122646 RepID=A0ABD3I7D4_9MARC
MYKYFYPSLGPYASTAQTASRHEPLHRRVSHIDLLAFDERANSWKAFAFHPRSAQVFKIQSFELGILSPREYWRTSRKTWLSKSVVASSDVPGQKLEIAGDGSMPFLFPNWVRIGDTICALISQGKEMFIASWNLKTGTLETKLLPLEYEDELQLLKAGIFLVASKFVLVILFEGGEVPESSALAGSKLRASELRFYDYEPEGCYFAEVYRTQGQCFTRYCKDLVADSECIHFVTLSYNIRGLHLTMCSFNVVQQTFQQRTEFPWTGEGVITCCSCFQPGLNPFAVP